MSLEERCDELQIERYQDGELGRAKRAQVEAHLSGCASCQLKAQLLSVQGQALREGLQAAAEQVDFAGFEQRVMRGVRAERPVGFFERWSLWTREVSRHYRVVWITSLATAALVLSLLVPLLLRQAPAAAVDNEVIINAMEYSGQRSMVFTVSKNNTTVIWLYDFDRAEQNATQGEEL